MKYDEYLEVLLNEGFSTAELNKFVCATLNYYQRCKYALHCLEIAMKIYSSSDYAGYTYCDNNRKLLLDYLSRVGATNVPIFSQSYECATSCFYACVYSHVVSKLDGGIGSGIGTSGCASQSCSIFAAGTINQEVNTIYGNGYSSRLGIEYLQKKENQTIKRDLELSILNYGIKLIKKLE